MDNKTYVDLVNQGKYPEDIKVPLDKPYVDHRGVIQNLWLGNCGSVTLITTKAGSKRAQHVHTIDENGNADHHACYVVSGEIKYTEGDSPTENLKVYTFKEGDMFFSPPNVWHMMEFPQDTVFITMNGICKNHLNYEKNIVRSK